MKQIYKLTRTVLCGTATLLLLSGCSSWGLRPLYQTHYEPKSAAYSSTAMAQPVASEANGWLPGTHNRQAMQESSGAVSVQSSGTTPSQPSNQSQTQNQSGTVAYHEPV